MAVIGTSLGPPSKGFSVAPPILSHRVEDPADDEREGHRQPNPLGGLALEFGGDPGRNQDDEQPDEDAVDGCELPRVREVLDALALALQFEQRRDHARQLDVTILRQRSRSRQLAQARGLQVEQRHRAIASAEHVLEIFGSERLLELRLQGPLTLGNDERRLPVLDAMGEVKRLPGASLSELMSQRGEPCDVPVNQRARRSIARSTEKVAGEDGPRATGVDDSAPDLPRLPESRVGGVALEPRHERNRRSEHGDRLPRDGRQPHAERRDRHRDGRDRGDDGDLAPGPLQDLTEGVVSACMHGRVCALASEGLGELDKLREEQPVRPAVRAYPERPRWRDE